MSLDLTGDLFASPPPRARLRDPATSHEAAALVERFAAGHQAQILEALRRFKRAGAEQIAAATKIDAYAIRKRLPEMQREGLVRVTGETRLTATGRHERVWEIVE